MPGVSSKAQAKRAPTGPQLIAPAHALQRTRANRRRLAPSSNERVTRARSAARLSPQRVEGASEASAGAPRAFRQLPSASREGRARFRRSEEHTSELQ